LEPNGLKEQNDLKNVMEKQNLYYCFSLLIYL